MNKRLIAYRKLLNLTQCEMSKKIGISLTSYNNKETGKKNFSQTEMIMITTIIKNKIPNATMDEIFFNNDISNLLSNIS